METLKGKRFGRLLALTEPREIDGKRYRCLCECECGQQVEVYYYNLLKGHTTSCGCWNREVAASRKGKDRYNWKGGRRKRGNGYVSLLQEDGSYRQEHILVVERKLGRKLLPDETVHHKNGLRDDNREENLELRVRAKHPAGASVDDLLEWAQDIIKRYGHLQTVRTQPAD